MTALKPVNTMPHEVSRPCRECVDSMAGSMPLSLIAWGDRLLKIGDLRVDPALDEICKDGVAIKLEPRAMRLLVCLAERPGQVLSVEELLDAVWKDVVVSHDSVYAAIAALRRMLGDDPRDPKYIANVVRRGYRLIAPVSPWGEAGADPLPAASAEWPSKPSIAVMPFANLSNDPEQMYFVDGLMDEVVSALTRIRTLFVIGSGSSRSLKGQALTPGEAARKLGVRYILEGSVRRAGEQIRIIVKLIDSSTDAQIWADRFEGRLENLFDLQDEVASGVAGVIEFSVQNAEVQRSAKRPTADLQSYDLYLRALVPFRTYTRAGIEKALELLNCALQTDPDFALALSLAASCHAVIAQYQWTDDVPAHGYAMMDLIKRSLLCGSDDPQVLGTAALTYWLQGEVTMAARLAERAAELNPGSSFPLLARAVISTSLGELEVAEECVQRSMRLDPLSPNRNLQLGALASIRLAQRRFSEALTFSQEATHVSASPTSIGLMASAYGHLNDKSAAQAALAQVAQLTNMSMPQLAAIFYQQPEHRRVFLEGVTRAQDGHLGTEAGGCPSVSTAALPGNDDVAAAERLKVE